MSQILASKLSNGTQNLSQVLFDHSRDALIVFDPSTLQILQANPAAQQLTGWTQAQLNAGTVEDLLKNATQVEDFLKACGAAKDAAQTAVVFAETPSLVDLSLKRFVASNSVYGLIQLRVVPELNANRNSGTSENEQRTIIGQIEPSVTPTEPRSCNPNWQLPQLVDGVKAIVWEAEARTWKFTFVSEEAESMLGYPIGQWLTQPDFWISLLHGHDRDGAVANRKDSTRLAKDHQFDYRARKANGEYLWLRDIVRVITDQHGIPVLLRGVMIDIDAQKRTERALRESEAQRERTEEFALVMPVRMDLNGRWMKVTPRLCKFLGYEEHELLGQPCSVVTHPNDREQDAQYLRRLLSGSVKSFDREKRYVRKDGQTAWAYVNCSIVVNRDGEPVHLLTYIREITARVRAEQALRDSEEKYRSLVKNATVCIKEVDLDGRILSMNPAGLKMIELSDEADIRGIERELRASEASLAKAQEIAKLGNWQLDFATGQLSSSAQIHRIFEVNQERGVQEISSVSQFIHPDDQQDVNRALQTAMLTGQPKTIGFRYLSESGTVRHLCADAEMVRDSEGKFTGMFGTLQDITEQKEAELALRESEYKFRVISDNCPAMVAIVQGEKLRYANAVFSTITGYSSAEIMSMSFLDFIDPEYRQVVKDRNRRRLLNEDVPSRYEFKIRTKSGAVCWIDFTANLIEYEGTNAVLCIAVDVTERRLTEARLRQREVELAHVSRLSTMGEMVAGIAHEINQPLSAISNFSEACSIELAKVQNDQVSSIRRWSEQIGKQAVRCGSIIERLRGYVKRNRAEETSIKVNEVIAESLDLLRHEILQSRISVECEVVSPSPTVRGSRVEIQQVIVNLLSNAHEALKLSNLVPRRLIVRSILSDTTVQIDVEDNGPGIEREHHDRLFEAFFTTKTGGMGMGLAISRSIIERHDGQLWAENRTPQGAVFHIRLPVASGLDA